MIFFQKDNFFTEEESLIMDQMLLDETKHFPWFFARSQVEQDNIPYFSHTLVDRDGKVTSHFFDFFHICRKTKLMNQYYCLSPF